MPRISSPIVARTVLRLPASYVVDGLALGGQLIFGADAYKQYQCSESEQFPAFIWCQKQRQEPSRWGGYVIEFHSAHSAMDRPTILTVTLSLHISIQPVLGLRLRACRQNSANVCANSEFRPRWVAKVVIAVWGRIELDRLTAGMFH